MTLAPTQQHEEGKFTHTRIGNGSSRFQRGGRRLATAAEITPEQLAELKARAAKADEHWDRLLRTAADFENFKKRAARERHEAAQSAAAALIHKLLPVLDHFEMAQAAAQNAKSPPAMLPGGDFAFCAAACAISKWSSTGNSLLISAAVADCAAS